MWEDWPPCQWPEGVISLCHWSNILTNACQTSLGQNTFCPASSHFLECADSLRSKTPQHRPGSPREMHGDLGLVSSFQKSVAEPRTGAPVTTGRGMRCRQQALHGWWGSQLCLQCQSPVGHKPQLGTLQSSVSKVNRYLATRAGRLGWGRGSQ